MITAMIRNADDAVDKELDYSRYNLGVKDLWSTGNAAREAGKQLTPGIDVSSLMGGTAGQGLGSVFDIAGVTVGNKAPAVGKAPAKSPSFADTNNLNAGGADSTATTGVSAPGADLGGFAGRSNIGNIAVGALTSFGLGALGPIGTALSVAATLAGVNKADMVATALGLTDAISVAGIMGAQNDETSAVAEAATAANSAEQAAAQDAETSAVAAAATAAAAEAEAAAAGAESTAGGIDSAAQDAAQSAETSAVADAATNAANDSASEGGMSGMGDSSQGGGPDGPSGGNDAGDGSW